jgi:hypothetical protein
LSFSIADPSARIVRAQLLTRKHENAKRMLQRAAEDPRSLDLVPFRVFAFSRKKNEQSAWCLAAFGGVWRKNL